MLILTGLILGARDDEDTSHGDDDDARTRQDRGNALANSILSEDAAGAVKFSADDLDALFALIFSIDVVGFCPYIRIVDDGVALSDSSAGRSLSTSRNTASDCRTDDATRIVISL